MPAGCRCLEDVAARLLVEAGAVLRGRFRLSSGRESDIYIDARRLIGDSRAFPAMLGLLAAHARHLAVGAHAVVGVATGGIPWAVGLALLLGLPAGYVRLEAKGHGTQGSLEGWRGRGPVILVDDVATTGGSLARAAAILRSHGAEPMSAVVIVDREEGAAERLAEHDIVLEPLTTLSAVRKALGEPA